MAALENNSIQQEYADTCAIKSQQLILNDFGVPVSEDQLVQYSIEHGWYSGDGTGTQMGDVGKLLAEAGIPCTQTVNANVFDLANELAQGHKVIVGVDSGELWDNKLLGWWNDFFHGDTPDHALVVAGIDMADPNNPMVILTDPGTGQESQAYPMDQFMDAWSDSKHFMVSTDIPTPNAAEAFQSMGEDYHLPVVAGVEYGTFDMFHNYSHYLPDASTWMAATDPMTLLYNAFDTMPTAPYLTFDDAIASVGLPPIDASLFSMNSPFNPSSFNYDSFGYDLNNPTVQHSIQSLENNYDDCMRYAQDAMDSGSPVTAQLFINQAHEAQNAIDNIVDA
jgi:hypothetical protein